MPSPSGITITAVERRYGDEPVLAGIDLTVDPGECLALLGPSGCGKTTLLRLIAGLDPVERGSIAIGDRVMSSPAETVAPERRGVGMVFQDGALFAHLSVTRNVGFGLGRAERRGGARIDEMLELVGLPGFGDRMPDELSGGEAQRVALARALAPAPSVLLLDEPFSNLDAVLRRRLRDDVRSVIREAGVTTVLVTHDRDEAFRLGDRVAMLRDGQVAQIGSPRDLYDDPGDAWAAEFLGEAGWVWGHVDRGEFLSSLARLSAPDRPDGPARLLVRPEHLELLPTDQGAEAVVIDVQFGGPSCWVRVELRDGTELTVRTAGGRESPVAGSRVGVRRVDAPVVLVDPA